MDQGVAAVWAGIAGLAGAGIGGGFAAWGSWIGGKKAVEAAERAEQRAASSEHQHWQREKRYEVYREFMNTLDEVARWNEPPTLEQALDMANRLQQTSSGLHILGSAEVAATAGFAMMPLLDALVDHQTNGEQLLGEFLTTARVAWSNDRARQVRDGLAQYQEAVRTVLDTPPY